MKRLLVGVVGMCILSAGIISAQTLSIPGTLNTVTATTPLEPILVETVVEPVKSSASIVTEEAPALVPAIQTTQYSAPVSEPVAPTRIEANIATAPLVAPVQPNDSAPRVLKEDSIATQQATPVAVPTLVTVPSVAPGPAASIPEVGRSLREFSREARIIETAVQTSVSEEVDKAMQKARIASTVFDPEERAERIAALKEKVQRKQDALSSEVRTAIASGNMNDGLAGIQPALRSSLDDIELLIEAETGTDIDLSSSERALIDVVTERTERFTAARAQLLARDGLGLYTDSDKDGVSDYDEARIYRTDPLNAYTAGSALTDGERILLGFDVHSTTTGRVAVESPKTAGDVVEGVFELYSIDVKPADEAVPEAITFTGRALPNSFVTLYIFSTPVIVTIKTDSSGAWSYTLESELEDGSHELHVATVDDSGRILAKSPVIPFVKVAEAAEFTPLIVPTTPEVDPLDVLRNNLLFVIGIALALFALAAVTILGIRKQPDDRMVA